LLYQWYVATTAGLATESSKTMQIQAA